MQQSKLLTLLRSFTKDELKRFELFLLSPYFNQSEKLVKFFRLIEPYQPLFNSNKLEKEKIYKALHGKSKYNDQTMRELISGMFKLAKTFVGYEELYKNSAEASALKYKWLYGRNLEKLADAELDTWSTELSNITEHGHAYYGQMWALENHKFQMRADQALDTVHKTFKDFDCMAHVHALNRSYLVNCLSSYHYLFTIRKIIDYDLDETSLKHIEFFARPYIDKGDKLIDLLYHAFQLSRTDDEKHFYELKKRIFENDPTVPREEMLSAIVALKNYCATKIGEAHKQFTAEMMHIARFEVVHNYHLYQGKVSYSFYFNVVAIGTITTDIDWTEQFVEENKQNLPEEWREDAYNYARAHILFGRKEYKDALRLALQCRIPFFVVKILIRNLVARAQYQLGMLNEVMIELDTHKHHLKDTKIQPHNRQSLLIFIKVMRQLCELKGNYDPVKLKSLSDMIDKTEAFANKWWFEEKIRELQRAHTKARHGTKQLK